MKISPVIPTKNRPHDLLVAVQSIARQVRRPDQLVIIDQSGDVLGRDLVRAEMQRFPEVELTYVHDQAISGLVAAKAESLKFATGDVICFLEDDVVLEDDYIGEIEKGFLEDATMLGCSGVITNPPTAGRLYLLMFNIFHRGIYRDGRPVIYAGITHQSTGLLASDVLSGGLSAWRDKVFDAVPFDVRNGFHMLVDFLFS
jgi:glycosyltransferase involved in cell wall biosynthesis